MTGFKQTIAFLLVNVLLAVHPVFAATVVLPAGTPIPITIYNTVSSDNLKNGDRIGVSINKDVVKDGVTFFKRGGFGTLDVVKAKRGRLWGGPGLLEISGGKLTDVNGEEHPFGLSVNAKGEHHRIAAVLVSIIGVLLIFIPFGCWIEGEPATLQGGASYDALLNTPVELTTQTP